jgi:2-succinyl-5-enolpyruvyl-6-hydroxy-3-cyclohexene-1-carboxylate synthase
MATINRGVAGIDFSATALGTACARAIEVESNNSRRELRFFHIIFVP